jgi:hypothetical protein
MSKYVTLGMTMVANARDMAMLFATAFAATVTIGAPELAAATLQLGTSTYQIFSPLGAATPAMPMIWNIPIQDPANAAKSLEVAIPVSNIAVFNPATETVVQASARKADSVKMAIDAAVTAGTLPNNVTATVKQAMVPTVVRGPGGVPVRVMVPGLSWIQIAGVSKAVSVGTLKQPDPTKEAGGGANWQANPGGQTPSTRPSMSGSGSSSGLSSGLDPSGNQSLVGFGFWDPTMSNPTLFIDAVFPTSGENDGQVLGDLASLFNSDFASNGFTATYDPLTDTLTLDQAIPGTNFMWFADTDTGLNFIGDNPPTPLPAALPLFATGLGALGLLAWRRKRKQAA